MTFVFPFPLYPSVTFFFFCDHQRFGGGSYFAVPVILTSYFFYSRLDLRPNDAETDAAAVDGEAPMAPPLDAEAAAAATTAAAAAESSADATTSGNRRRATRLFDLHRLRHATVEERIEALRRFRVENQAENGGEGSATAAAAAVSPADNGEEAHRERLAKRLRDKFRIRTRAQEPNSSSSN